MIIDVIRKGKVVAFGSLNTGAVFESKGTYYQAVYKKWGDHKATFAGGANLLTGELKDFSTGTQVRVVKARVVIEE